MVSQGVGCALNMMCYQLEVEGGGQKPNLTKAQGSRATRVQGKDAVVVITVENKSLTNEELEPTALKPP